jgi:hypothetical protein
MSEHITQWLGAYHDGELRGAHLRQVENHLAECAECQSELEGMQGLSALLHETAPAGEFLPTERFVANLTLNLPRQPESAQPRKALEIGWWLVPVGLLGTWVFIQITFSLSSAVLFAADAGLLGSNLSWLQGNPPQMSWFALATNLLGGQVGVTGQVALSALNDAHLFVTQLTGSLLPQILLAVLYLGWLAAWWLRHQSRSSQSTGNFSQS